MYGVQISLFLCSVRGLLWWIKPPGPWEMLHKWEAVWCQTISTSFPSSWIQFGYHLVCSWWQKSLVSVPQFPCWRNGIVKMKWHQKSSVKCWPATLADGELRLCFPPCRVPSWALCQPPVPPWPLLCCPPVGDYVKALECAKSYLLFHPDDEDVLENAGYYEGLLEGTVDPATIKPRKVSDWLLRALGGRL